ncbi:DUF1206 domain-containing protein [Telluribacter humicola]|uniref:DUF1206 domain-containing protein n=1 Tax=Telluribacter humicola TaxID=1720261 RepID=UPI001A964EF5|nr:DUF1206 domain-containing protein [Telluribacter humicola]
MSTESEKLINRDLLIKRTAQIGLIANGIVYSLIGLITFGAAFEFSYRQGGRFEVLDWLYQLPYGEAILSIVTVGLLCYAAWRFIQGVMDTEKNGKTLIGIANRIGYLFTGFVYIAFAYHAIKLTAGITIDKNDEISRQTVVEALLMHPYGRWMVGAIAVATMSIGVFQAYHALSGGYRNHVEECKLREENKIILIKTGYWGFLAVGVVWLILGYMLLRAAIYFNPTEAGDDTSAFYFMEYFFGPKLGSAILGLVAAGLLCFGLFNFVRAQYEYIKTPD